MTIRYVNISSHAMTIRYTNINKTPREEAGEFILHIDLVTKAIPLELFSDMIPSSSANNITKRVAWRMKVRKAAWQCT